MTTIVTWEDIQENKSIAIKLAETRVVPFIEETERMRIIPVIGFKLYQNLVDWDTLAPVDKLITDEQYAILVNGGGYDTGTENINRNHYNGGLKRAIIYLTYSRLILQNQVNVTAFGVVSKLSDLSAPVDTETLVRTSNANKMIGEEILAQCQTYLATIETLKNTYTTHKPIWNNIRVIGE